MMVVRFNGFLQINSSYWIIKNSKNPYFEEVKGKKVKIHGFQDFDLFAHKTIKGKLELWSISEAISGKRISKYNKSLKKAMKSADRILSDKGTGVTEQAIRDQVGHEMISPRYRFVVNPNKISYVAIKKSKNSKSIFPRRYRVRVHEQ